MRRFRTGASVARSIAGLSLVELTICAGVMALASAGIFGLLVSTGAISQKVSNKMDSINACRTVLERVSKDVRAGRALGDLYGNNVVLWVEAGQDIRGFHGSDVFPGNRNPLYGNGQSPPGGWPWQGPPYKLDNATFIVQVPIFDSDGYPATIPAGVGNPASTSPQDNVETHIYRVLPDSRNPGEFILQMSKIAGYPVPGYSPATVRSTPTTVLTGIVGPLDDQGNPKIFQYLDKTDASGTPRDFMADPGLVTNITGAIMNLEVMKQAESNRRPVALGLKTEVFLRNNALSTTVGSGSP